MTPYEMSYTDALRAMGERAKRLRLVQNLRQGELAERAGVNASTIKRFEKTGQASIENALRIATALRAEATFEKLFEAPPFSSLDEALAVPESGRHRARVKRS